jgi:hypothetical protein
MTPDIQDRYDAGRTLVQEAGALAARYFARLDELRVTAKGRPTRSSARRRAPAG